MQTANCFSSELGTKINLKISERQKRLFQILTVVMKSLMARTENVSKSDDTLPIHNIIGAKNR